MCIDSEQVDTTEVRLGPCSVNSALVVEHSDDVCATILEFGIFFWKVPDIKDGLIDWLVVVLRHVINKGHIHGEKRLTCILSIFIEP